jgi:hypothetical protein
MVKCIEELIYNLKVESIDMYFNTLVQTLEGIKPLLNIIKNRLVNAGSLGISALKSSQINAIRECGDQSTMSYKMLEKMNEFIYRICYVLIEIHEEAEKSKSKEKYRIKTLSLWGA